MHFVVDDGTGSIPCTVFKNTDQHDALRAIGGKEVSAINSKSHFQLSADFAQFNQARKFNVFLAFPPICILILSTHKTSILVL